MAVRAGIGLTALLVGACAGLVSAGPAAAAEAALVSELRAVQPATRGLDLTVAGGDRFLLLRNQTGRQVTVRGYEDEPYLRFRPSGVVEENVRAPTKYANADRYALTPLPAQADSGAQPKWRAVSRDGSYRWFDHRIHSMDRGKPSQVTDESVRTKIFDWSVPMTVGQAKVRALGTLTWVPAASSGGTSAAPLVGAAAAALILVALALLLVRRRSRMARTAGDDASGRRRDEAVDEAW